MIVLICYGCVLWSAKQMMKLEVLNWELLVAFVTSLTISFTHNTPKIHLNT